jgi:hypothetical protein
MVADGQRIEEQQAAALDFLWLSDAKSRRQRRAAQIAALLAAAVLMAN